MDVDFVPLHKLLTDIDAPIKKGIDSIFENLLFKSPPMPPPPKYIINETKYTTSKAASFSAGFWKGKLAKTKRYGKQLEKEWIEHNLTELIKDTKLRYDILENHETFLTGVSKKGIKVEIFQLTKNAKKIKK